MLAIRAAVMCIRSLYHSRPWQSIKSIWMRELRQLIEYDELNMTMPQTIRNSQQVI